MALITRSLLSAFGTGAAVLFFAPAGYAVDADAARRLAKKNDCFKCHAIAKDKDGPAYRKIAAKYRNKANAQVRLVEHVTLGDPVKFPDGREEEHKIVKTAPPDDMQQIRNLVQWILAQ